MSATRPMGDDLTVSSHLKRRNRLVMAGAVLMASLLASTVFAENATDVGDNGTAGASGAAGNPGADGC